MQQLYKVVDKLSMYGQITMATHALGVIADSITSYQVILCLDP